MIECFLHYFAYMKIDENENCFKNLVQQEERKMRGYRNVEMVRG